jgi:excisionase family DNA binding protein
MLTDANQRLLSVAEAAKLLGLHPMTVRRKIRAGQLPAVQLGGSGTAIRIPAGELDAWLESEPERTEP